MSAISDTEKMTVSKPLGSEQIKKDLYPRKFGLYGKIWVGVLLLIFISGLVAYIDQLKNGLSITDLTDYATWGIYISNFVFFVAISLVGSLMSAILKLTKVSWRTPLTRISEMIAVAAIIFAGLVIIVDMGRPDRIHHILIYARLQSPITWDVIVISTYLAISLIFLFMPLLPDLAIMRDHFKNIPKWQKKLYNWLAMGWKNTEAQRRILFKSETILAIMIIPVAFAIHTVTSWLFATTVRPGWDSSNFGPYFVSGAFMVGAGGVIAAMYIFRRFYKLENYFTDFHFDKMGKLLVLLSLVYLYFNINEYFVPAYKMKTIETEHIYSMFTGHYAPMFWATQIIGMVIPIIVLLFKKGRKPLPMFIISILVIIGAWFKRYLIVIPTLAHPLIPTHRVPEDWLIYAPTLKEWGITAATLAGALLIITALVRYFPIIPIDETIHEQKELDTSKE
jgi:molybdopterin-containing oxidoreductase family membrane subunit